jgi:hypothetical protein
MIIVPIDGVPYPIHDGHKALIKYAQEFGDTKVLLSLDTLGTNNYILTGRDAKPENISIRVKSIKDLGVPCVTVFVGNKGRNTTYNIDRDKLLLKTNTMMEEYSKSLILPIYISAVTGLLYRCLWKKEAVYKRYDVAMSVRGPDIPSLFYASICEGLGRPPCKIYPKVVKNEKYGIQEQTLLTKLPTNYLPSLERLRMVSGGIRKRCQVGLNSELVEEVNNAYVNVPWRIRNIVVYEGGFVKGRMEIIHYEFRLEDSGSIIIEDSEYYAN